VKLFRNREAQAPEPIEPPGPTRVDVSIGRLPEMTVRHVIERKIPRPTRMMFVFTDNEGRQWRSSSVDLSYRDTYPIQIPMAFLTGDTTRPPCDVTVQLEYDPKDR
jgi:hypothetical protein